MPQLTAGCTGFSPYIRGVFEDLPKHFARQYDWTLVPEYSIPRKDRNPLGVDGALLDAFNLPRGYWEAKDEKDSLEVEMKRKFEAGYPRSNILFQRPTEPRRCFIPANSG